MADFYSEIDIFLGLWYKRNNKAFTSSLAEEDIYMWKKTILMITALLLIATIIALTHPAMRRHTICDCVFDHIHATEVFYGE